MAFNIRFIFILQVLWNVFAIRTTVDCSTLLTIGLTITTSNTFTTTRALPLPFWVVLTESPFSPRTGSGRGRQGGGAVAATPAPPRPRVMIRRSRPSAPTPASRGAASQRGPYRLVTALASPPSRASEWSAVGCSSRPFSIIFIHRLAPVTRPVPRPTTPIGDRGSRPTLKVPCSMQGVFSERGCPPPRY